jgi:glycosyltransferase involved in cell wall biosynthesis
VHKPAILLVGRTRYRLPLAPSTAAKFDALGAVLRVHVLASAAPGSCGNDHGFTLVGPLRPRALDGVVFWLSLPWRVARLLRGLGPDLVMAQSPYEGLAALTGRVLAGVDTRVIVEVHGDWRTATRLYGSPLRSFLAPVADHLARVALRHADGVRTLSPFTTRLVREIGVEPAGTFTAYIDLSSFAAGPPVALPSRPAVLFVGVLERYKDVGTLLAAWRVVAELVPDATLRVIGRGHEQASVERLVREGAGRVSWSEQLTHQEVADALDAATLLALPSRSEGLPRIAMEAFLRGRAVVGTRAGGIPDIVDDGVNGLLVPPGEVDTLAGAIARVLSDVELARRLSAGAADSARRWLVSPEEYAARVRALVDDLDR